MGGNISTVAGNGNCCYQNQSEGGPATSAQLSNPQGVAVDAADNLYIADLNDNRVLRVATNGIITTVAGNGSCCNNTGDGGPATSATISNVWSVALDSAGNIYLGDGYNHSIRRVSNGIITTLAGTGNGFFGGDGGLATSAQLANPQGLAVDPSGKVYIADYNNGRVRKVSGSTITTIAGTGGCCLSGNGGPATSAQLQNPRALALDSTGNLYIADQYPSVIREVSTSGIITSVAGGNGYGYGGDGAPAISAVMASPQGIVVDSSGNIYVADNNNNRIRKFTVGGNITTIAGTGAYGYAGDGGAATGAQFRNPTGLALDSAGNLYVADSNNQRIRMITPGGIISTVAGNGNCCYSGDGGPATSAQLNYPNAVAVDAAGNLYIADTNNGRIRFVSSNGIISTIAGGNGNGYSGDGGLATSAQMTGPNGIALDAAGNIYVADQNNNVVRVLTPVALSIEVPNPLSAGFISLPYSASLVVEGGHPTYTWSLASGALPNGLTLSPSGTISGTPTATGVSSFTVKATDDTGATNTAATSITINNPIPSIANLSTVSAMAGSAGFTLTVNGSGFVNGASTVQWGGDPRSTAFVSANQLTATINTADLAGTGTFNVTVVNAAPGGGTSSNAPFAVIANCSYLLSASSDGAPLTASTGSVSVTAPIGCSWTAASNSNFLNITSGASGSGNGTVGYSVAANTGSTRSGTLTIAGQIFTVTQTVASGAQYVISTYAGGVATVSPAPALSTAIGSPGGVVADAAGNAYFAALYAVYKVDASGTLSRIAGNNRSGASGDGGPAVNAQLSENGLAMDAAGNIYVADPNNNRVRKISPNGIITTYAGNGNCCFFGDGGAATNAGLNNPNGVALDSSGNLYIADSNNQRIRMVTPGGIITTVAGNGTFGFSGDGGAAISAELANPRAVAVDPSGNLYIGDSNNARIRKVGGGIITTIAGTGTCCYSGDGGPATSAQIQNPQSLAFDSAGNLYLADGSVRVRQISPSGIITTVAGNGNCCFGGDGGPATSAQLSGVQGVALDAAGNLYIADNSSHIRRVSDGIITTIAGNGIYNYSGEGPVATSQLGGPRKVALDSSGNLYIAESNNNRIRKITPGGTVSTVAGNGICCYSGDGGPATSAQFNQPQGVAVDASGNIYISDYFNNRVRMVSPAGIITTIAGNGNYGYSGDGSAATNAQLRDPAGLARDAAGNIYVADSQNNVVRKFSVGGNISTFAGNGSSGFSGDGNAATSAKLNNPNALAFDTAGNLYIADTNNYRVRKVSTNGTISTVAGNGNCCYSGDGGQATNAQFSQIYGVAVDQAGNLYTADTANRIRVVAPNGIVTTIAGGPFGYSGDGGPAVSAAMAWPYDIAIAPGGNLYVPDYFNNAIRLLTPLALAIPATTLAPAPINLSYSQTLVATGGLTPYTWSVTSGSLPTGLTLSAGGLISGTPTVAGTSNFTVQVMDSASSTASAGLSITVNSGGPIIASAGIVNTASFTAPLVPGSAASIFGSNLAATAFSTGPTLPTSLSGTSVTFNGTPAPLSYVSPGQINLQVPWELAGQTTASVIVTTTQGASSPVNVSLASQAPGIFTTNSSGQGSIYNPDRSQNSSSDPAYPGAQIQIFVTGLGAVSNQPADGVQAGANATVTTLPTVTIGGIAATVVSAQLTTTYFSNYVGAYQVIVTVPAGITTGNSVAVVMTAGGITSNVVTMAIAASAPSVTITNGSNFGTWLLGPRENGLNSTGGNGTYVWALVSGTLPPGCSLRPDFPTYFSLSTTGNLSCVTTTTGNYSFTLSVTSNGQTATQAFTARVTDLRLKDQFITIPDAFVNVPYTGFTFTAIGNAAAVTWTASGLPPGMSVSTSGVISGTPTSSGFYNPQLTMNDGTDTVTANVYLNVYVVQITSPRSFPNATQYQSYSTAITASGGTSPYTFTSNNLPNGLTLNSATGVISGTVTAGPTLWGFTVTATDANHVSYSENASISVIGYPKHLMEITAGNLDDCTIGNGCGRTISLCCGGTAPFTWTATGLPNGMSIRSGVATSSQGLTPGNAELWGVPDTLGSSNIQVTVTDADGNSATQSFTLAVSPLQLQFGFVNGIRGVPYSGTLRLIGGTGPYSEQQIVGTYPGGLTLNGLVMSGTPLENGRFNVEILYSDSASHTVRQNTGITISDSGTSTLSINNGQSLGTALLNSGYSSQFSACCVPSYAWTLLSGTLPPGLTLSPSGVLSGTPNTIGVYTFLVQVADASNSGNTAARDFTLTVTPLNITTNGNLPYGNVGAPYSQTFATSGGTGTITWSLVPFNYLPPGLTLSNAGVLSGSPTQEGYYFFTITATDTAGHTRTFTPNVSIYPAGIVPPLQLNFGPNLGNYLIGVYNFQLTASGGVPPYHFSYTPSATLVPGMRVLDGAPLPSGFPSTVTGSFAGIVTTPNLYTTSLRVTDSTNATFDMPITWNVVNLAVVTSTSASIPPVTVGAPYSFTFTGFGGSGNYSWSSNNLPPGLSISTSGTVSGTPTTAGAYNYTITLTDLTSNVSLSFGYSILVNAFSITTGGVLPQGTIGVAYSQTFSASGCGTGCTWTLGGGSLPPGLSLSSAGVLSGTPNSFFNSGFQVQVAGSNGTVHKEFSLLINFNTIQPLFITNGATLGPNNLNNNFSTALNAQGGTPPYTWSLASGSLPPGITIQGPGENLGNTFFPGFMYLAGKVMQVGNYSFTLQVADAANATATQAFTWNVLQPSINYTSMPANGVPLVYNSVLQPADSCRGWQRSLHLLHSCFRVAASGVDPVNCRTGYRNAHQHGIVHRRDSSRGQRRQHRHAECDLQCRGVGFGNGQYRYFAYL